MKRRWKKMWGLLGTAAAAAVIASGCSSSPGRKELRLSGIEAMEQGNYETAITYFDQAMEMSKGRAGAFEIDILKYRADTEYALADYAAAAHTYDILYQVDKEKPEYLYRQSMAYGMDGDADGALNAYRKAWEMDKAMDREVSGQKEALSAAGTACENAGREEEAMALYEEALASGLQSSALYNKMAVCSIKEGDYEGALEWIDKGLQTGDETAYGDLKYNQAVVYEFLGDFAKARELMEDYAAQYGVDDNIEKELAFLRTR